ncbi:organelle RRM domain-containing protein 6, chloroplastic-like [Cucurbita pepo subsp. pepo]|uniref:organelle RRM domain-containing protein 6, chloroplastic-like n=1 Tax=Cucurbita pepo subsp. pepo TaxID=3664 RepID=UPI000C9D9F2B|nr:organelle RRM domain-containing protein 6, chloroplastic-like [Cucurbita pepo subsp. pepo]
MTAGLLFSAVPTPFFQLQSIDYNNIRSTVTRMRIQSIQSKLPYSTTPLPFFSVKKTRSISDSPLFSVTCVSSSPSPSPRRYSPSTRLYVSGLSFRTTEESLRNAFTSFGQLVEVNLVMDKVANRPRGFAFLRYATEEESQKAIEGMHGKFLDGRVIFVEVAKSKWELRQGLKENSSP